MKTGMNAVVVLARCSHSQLPFGIRFEEKTSGRWAADWAFAVQEAAAKREGYDRGSVSGSFAFDAAYPGCPSCRAASCFRCSCGNIACWNGEQHSVTCPWCRCTGELSSGTVSDLNVGGDR
jgi:hypothetical protein